MEFHWFIVVLLAAFMHASWNALVKVAADRLVILTAVALSSAVVGLCLIPFVDFPNQAVWKYLLISTAIHYAYYAFLFHAYRFGDFSQIYPLARGLAPILVTLAAYLFIKETLTPIEITGIAIASFGLFMLAFMTTPENRIGKQGMILAMGTALMISSYTVSDGIGVRLATTPMSFIAWLFFLEFPVVVFTMMLRGRQLIHSISDEWLKFLGVSVFSTAAYGLVIFASAYAPLGMVSAVRETSVIIASLMGVFILKEHPWQQRVAAASIIAFGVMLFV